MSRASKPTKLVQIVQIENEHREVDHLVLNENELTMCGRKWTNSTRREWFNDSRYETQCYRCQEAARDRVIRSLEASRSLARWAQLDWPRMLRAARAE